jgi:hypothetical protein
LPCFALFACQQHLKKMAMPTQQDEFVRALGNFACEGQPVGQKEGMQLTYADLVQLNARLAHDNMLLRAMQDNARLAHENMVLRMQSVTQASAPPGLESQATLGWSPWSSAQVGQAMAMSAPGVVTKRVQAAPHNRILDSGNLPCAPSDASTDAGSSHMATPRDSKRSSVISETPSLAERTSMMMRNLPNNYTQKMLLELLESEGYGGHFDFVYIPIDFQSNSGLGYAFLNFTSTCVAEHFSEHFTGFNRWSVNSDKVCKVTWSDALQGLDVHIERYRNSPVMHESVPQDQRPLLFSGSVQVPFPPPTKTVRAPRRWHRRR